MSPSDVSRRLERILGRVQKPARYTGGEWRAYEALHVHRDVLEMEAS